MVRPAAAGVVLGLALALGAPVAWLGTREPAAAGAPLEQVLPAPAPSPAGTPAPPGPVSLPAVTTRVAAPTAESAAPPPVALAVPSAGIEAPVDAVGVDDDGQMALPGDVDRVGWYRFGPAPGAGGSAVLAGHVDDVEQGLGVLAPLRDTAAGAEVLVTDAAGTVSRWRVVSRDTVEKEALALDRLFTRDGPSRLVLVTCGGPFVPELRSYRDNVVVVAEPAP
ncbi:sortase domain-bontaining protein [Geodermatophilus sp. SYSU D00742]